MMASTAPCRLCASLGSELAVEDRRRFLVLNLAGFPTFRLFDVLRMS
jgi:hypothetical protein